MTKSSETIARRGKDAPDASSVEQYIVKDPERFALNLARVARGSRQGGGRVGSPARARRGT